MVSISTQSKKFALLALAAIALTACGGSSENSNTASTVARGVKNAALSCATGGACVVGDTGPGGGKVFYVAPTSFASTGSACGTACKYLEAAPAGWIAAATPAGQTNCGTPGSSTADPGCHWSGIPYVRLGTTSYAIGAGYANTSAMIAVNNTAGKAVTVARAFQGGGKTDWYLPSKDELNQMYIQRSEIGSFGSGYYWSSSEFSSPSNPYDVWTQNFRDGYQDYLNKGNLRYVRPVRAFSGLTVVTTTSTTIAATTTTIPTCATGGACVVGDTGPGGGKVFYVAPTTFTSTGSSCGTACKYLEAAPAGWIMAATPAGQTNCEVPGSSIAEPKCAWSGKSATAIGTTSTAIGAGYANTSAMIAQINLAGRAATVARAFQGGGKTDWYLPSRDELNQMYLQKSVIFPISLSYWSSSEHWESGPATRAWAQNFGNGSRGQRVKSTPSSVRPVRAF